MPELSHIDPRSAALLVMDYQVDALSKFMTVAQSADVIACVPDLIALARDAGMMVIRNHTLLSQCTLILRQRAEDVEQEFARWRCSIHAFGQGSERHLVFLQGRGRLPGLALSSAGLDCSSASRILRERPKWLRAAA